MEQVNEQKLHEESRHRLSIRGNVAGVRTGDNCGLPTWPLLGGITKTDNKLRADKLAIKVAFYFHYGNLWTLGKPEIYSGRVRYIHLNFRSSTKLAVSCINEILQVALSSVFSNTRSSWIS